MMSKSTLTVPSGIGFYFEGLENSTEYLVRTEMSAMNSEKIFDSNRDLKNLLKDISVFLVKEDLIDVDLRPVIDNLLDDLKSFFLFHLFASGIYFYN